MIVVADSGPLHYLILLGEAVLLHDLYADVLIPPVDAGISSPGLAAGVTGYRRPQRPALVRDLVEIGFGRVGLGVIANNLVSTATFLSARVTA